MTCVAANTHDYKGRGRVKKGKVRKTLPGEVGGAAEHLNAPLFTPATRQSHSRTSLLLRDERAAGATD